MATGTTFRQCSCTLVRLAAGVLLLPLSLWLSGCLAGCWLADEPISTEPPTTCSVAGASVSLRLPLALKLIPPSPSHLSTHPPTDYTSFNVTFTQRANDIALLALTRQSSAPTVALPTAALPPAGERVWAAGYGVTENRTASSVLRYTDLRVMAVLPDGKATGGFSDNFCAGGFSGYTCQVRQWVGAWVGGRGEEERAG